MFKELKDDLVEFCSTTSIQGMRNLTDPKQGCMSRSIWTIVVIASFVLSGICIKESIDGTCNIKRREIRNFLFKSIRVHLSQFKILNSFEFKLTIVS